MLATATLIASHFHTFSLRDSDTGFGQVGLIWENEARTQFKQTIGVKFTQNVLQYIECNTNKIWMDVEEKRRWQCQLPWQLRCIWSICMYLSNPPHISYIIYYIMETDLNIVQPQWEMQMFLKKWWCVKLTRSQGAHLPPCGVLN